MASAAASLLCFFAALSGFAASQQETQPPGPRTTVSPTVPSDAVETARKALETAQARSVAGVASREELEEAQAALRIAVANAFLSDARAAAERQKVQVAAGLYPVHTLAESEFEREVALLQAQTDHLAQVTARLQVQVAAGVLSRAEMDTASQKLRTAQRGLAIRKEQHSRQKISLLNQRLLMVMEQQRAGIVPQSDVDKARVDYETALAESVKIK